MSKIILYSFLFCHLISFAACKKDKDNVDTTDYYVSAKVDGVEKIYKADAIAVKLQVDTTYGVEFSAFAVSGGDERLFLDIAQVNKPITAGTYIDAALDDLVVVGGYNPGTKDEARLYAAGYQIDNNPRLHITIASLTDKNVSGTFYGTYYDNGGDGPGTVAITEGKFNLAFP